MSVLPPDDLVLGFGGNVGGEREIIARFEHARAALGELGPVRSAPLYRTAPIGPEQPAFLNTAVRVRAPGATPDELVALIRELEHLLGRDRAREIRWGPRTIDLDLLVWGERKISTPSLEVPHPRITERRFVLAPLIALVGEEFLVEGQPLERFMRATSAQEIAEIAARW